MSRSDSASREIKSSEHTSGRVTSFFPSLFFFLERLSSVSHLPVEESVSRTDELDGRRSSFSRTRQRPENPSSGPRLVSEAHQRAVGICRPRGPRVAHLNFLLLSHGVLVRGFMFVWPIVERKTSISALSLHFCINISKIFIDATDVGHS